MLRLRKLEKLTGLGISELFSADWKNEHGGLREVDVQRVLELNDGALRAIVGHSGKQLEILNLNSDDQLTEQGLAKALNVETTPILRVVDFSFVRQVNDQVLQGLMAIPAMEKIGVFGCNRVVSGAGYAL